MVEFHTNLEVATRLTGRGWFGGPGAYVLVDGQFGSTGKGLLASVLGEVSTYADPITVATSNAGPNSGHTAFLPGDAERKLMTQQLPIAAAALWHMGYRPIAYLNGGAILDPEILLREASLVPRSPMLVLNPQSAVIDPEDVSRELGGAPARIAGTGKGVGSALARKAMREGNVAKFRSSVLPGVVDTLDWDWDKDIVFVETAQGFSLGIHSDFYPHTTSRECSVQQALADARIPISKVRKVAACYRTFPIRVGNTEIGNSGYCYSDQIETSWEALGLEPEYTSVTKRVRRVFTWSRTQFRESLAVNEPDVVFINFVQYISDKEELRDFMSDVYEDYRYVLRREPDAVLVGDGPLNSNVHVWTFQ